MSTDLQNRILARYTHEPNFQSALSEFLSSVVPYLNVHNATAEDYALLERLTVPERVIMFKVVWEDDKGNVQHRSMKLIS